MTEHTLNRKQLSESGIDIVDRDNGCFLVARFEVDELGPFDTDQEALDHAILFRPNLVERS